MATFIQLQTQIQKLQKEAESLRKHEMAETIVNIKRAIKAFGLTAEDLGLTPRAPSKHSAAADATAGTKRRGRPVNVDGALNLKETHRKRSPKVNAEKKDSSGLDRRSIVAPKYRDSNTGATWTGRGKQPKWLVQALVSGKMLQDFKI